jgi:antitoxin component YwqK of YwqJK toxin-antitoxin module
MRYLFLFSFLILFSFSKGQNMQYNVDEINEKFDASLSGYINGLVYKSGQEYKKAIFEFERVNRNDSLYDNALLELAILYYHEKDDSSLVDLCLNAIKLESEYDVDFREYLMEGMMNLKDDEVFMQIAIAKSKYPYNVDFLLKEAKAYRRFGRYEECKTVLQNVILNNPFCANAHYYLGKLLADEGDFIRASMSLETFLLLSSKGSLKTDTAVDVLNQLFNNKYDATIKNAKRNDLFKELEELVESKVALNSKYKPDAPLTFNMSKQTDLILKNIKYKEGTGDFWMDFYVPFLVKVKSNKFVRAYNYQFLAFIGNPDVNAGMTKYKAEIDAYIKFASDYFDKIREDAGMMIEGKMVHEDKYYDDGYLWGVGKMVDDTKVGPWYFFHNNGTIQSKVSYNKDGEMIDSVYTYHPNGKRESVYFSAAGLTNGDYVSYYANGELDAQYRFKADSLDGEQKDYRYNGALEEVSKFSNGKRHGLDQKYESNGMLASDEQYRNGKRDGHQVYYYHDKKVEVEMDYKNGKVDGKYVSYHKNGKVKKTGQYVNDIATGKWEDFYSTGVKEGYFFLNEKGEFCDSALVFYPNGKLETVSHYGKKGKKNGAEITYTDNGTLWSVFNFKNGVIKNYTYYTSDGKIVHQGKLNVENYDEAGRLVSKGSYKKDHRIGRWEFFHPNGETREICTYDELGQLTDLDETFYKSGELESKTYFKNGEKVGVYTSYHENGKMKCQGFYLNDVRRGEWKWWYSNGNPDEVDYFQKGIANGIVEVWNPDSTANYEVRYIMGDMRDYYYYDDKGNEIFKIETQNGSGKFQVKDPESHLTFSGTYKHGNLDGKSKTTTESGVVLAELNYQEGERNGVCKYKYPNGALSSELNYVFGDNHGDWKYYYADGTLSQLHHYSFGVEVDTTVYFYPSGAVYCKIAMNAFGEEEGVSTWFYETGKIKKQITYKNALCHGWAYDCDPSGKIYIQRYYENGVMLKAKGLSATGDTIIVNSGKGSGADSLTFFHDNGKVAFSGKVQRGLYEGTIIRYAYNGTILEKADYFHDKRHGQSIFYYANGKIYSDEYYSMGELHGDCKEYFESGQISMNAKYYLGDFHGDVKMYNKKGVLLVDAVYDFGQVLKNKLKQ